MARRHVQSNEEFLEALFAYDEELAKSQKGIIQGVNFGSDRGKKTNIIVTIIGFIVGVFTGHGFYRVSEPETGSLVLAQNGVYFVRTETEKTKEDGKRVRKLIILDAIFLPYNKMRKAIRSRTIVFGKELRIVGRYVFDELHHREAGYRLDIMLSSEINEPVEALKSQLKENDVPIKKSRIMFMLGLMILIFLGGIFIGLIMPRQLNTYRAIDMADLRWEINNPTHTASGRYQDRTTSFSARIATNVFTIEFEDGNSSEFVGATVAGNDRLFLLELDDISGALAIGGVYNITAVGVGAVTTRPVPEEDAFDRFFRALGVMFGDPRITGVVAEASADILVLRYYLHMRVVDFESVEVVVVADSDTYVSAGGNFQITFVDAYHTEHGVGQRRTDIIVVYYDYLALAAHRANRPFGQFVIYDGDEALEVWGGGLRAGDRDLVSVQELAAGEVVNALAAVVPVGPVDGLRIVKYDANFEVIFFHEIAVRDGE